MIKRILALSFGSLLASFLFFLVCSFLIKSMNCNVIRDIASDRAKVEYITSWASGIKPSYFKDEFQTMYSVDVHYDNEGLKLLNFDLAKVTDEFEVGEARTITSLDFYGDLKQGILKLDYIGIWFGREVLVVKVDPQAVSSDYQVFKPMDGSMKVFTNSSDTMYPIYCYCDR